MRFRRRHGRSFGSKRRKMAWGSAMAGGLIPGTIFGGETLPAAGWVRVPAGAVDTASLPEGVGSVIPEDWTLIRSIHKIQMSFTAVSTGALFAILGAGVIVWEGMSDAEPDVLTVPYPVSSGGADWLWKWTGPSAIPAAPATGLVYHGENENECQLMVESRAKRKLNSTQGLLLVTEWNHELGSAAENFNACYFSYHGSFLFAEP